MCRIDRHVFCTYLVPNRHTTCHLCILIGRRCHSRDLQAGSSWKAAKTRTSGSSVNAETWISQPPTRQLELGASSARTFALLENTVLPRMPAAPTRLATRMPIARGFSSLGTTKVGGLHHGAAHPADGRGRIGLHGKHARDVQWAGHSTCIVDKLAYYPLCCTRTERVACRGHSCVEALPVSYGRQTRDILRTHSLNAPFLLMLQSATPRYRGTRCWGEADSMASIRSRGACSQPQCQCLVVKITAKLTYGCSSSFLVDEDSRHPAWVVLHP